jgi:adenosine deaminase
MITALKPWRDRLLGLGLGGPEVGHPPAKFRKAFALAR